MNLDELAKKYGTDKSSDFHNYCVKYEKYLPFERESKISFLEIGVFHGQSLNTWREYFINAKIVGIDIDPECASFALDRINVEIGSQIDKEFIAELICKYGPFDLIIDDGSHQNAHISESFKLLFPSLNSGGVYVVEDAFVSYWKKYGGGSNVPNTAIEYFKALTGDIMFRGIRNPDKTTKSARREDWMIPISQKLQPDCRVDIESINFLNGLIIITKR